MKLSIRDYMFRVWYWYISKIDKNARIQFMNYGFHADNEPVELNKTDEENRYSIQLYHHLAKQVNIENKDIIEIGSGRGGGLSYIVKTFGPKTAIGVELNNKAVEFSNQQHGSGSLSYMQGDAQRLSLENNSCDVVLNVESSHRYPEFHLFVNEVQRILRPGGYFLFTDFRYDDKMEEMKQVLSNSGMQILNERTINKEVVQALDLDNERKKQLIYDMAPPLVRNVAHKFAGTKGTDTYQKLASGRFVYFSYLIQKGA